MSSITATSVLPNPTGTLSAPDNTSNGGGSDGGIAQRGANYFFGFLITFVVLLLIFVGCGIGSRRRYLRARQGGMFGNFDPWGLPRPAAEQKEPIFYEHHIGEARLEDKWIYTTPLSLTLLRQPKEIHAPDQDTDLESNAADAQTQNNDRPHHPRGIASLMIPFHERKQSPEPEPEPTQYGGPEALDIAVMIVMPSPQHPHSQHASSSPSPNHNRTNSETTGLPDMQIGVATLPWYTEIESGSVS